ncbi:MAG TPA: hypothetical protein PK765_02365 [bacterium]|nr:hypothetical protein [bacterium]
MLAEILAERYVDYDQPRRLLLLCTDLSNDGLKQFLKDRHIVVEVPVV